MSFQRLTPESIESGLDASLAKADAVLAELVAAKDQRTFENTLRPLDQISDILGHANFHYCFPGYVHSEKEVRAAAKLADEKRQKWASEMVFRDDLYQAVKEYSITDEAGALEGEHSRLLKHTLRDLRKAGHELDPETREMVKQKTLRLTELEVQFQQNIDEWEDGILVTREDLEGLPDGWINSLKTDEETGQLKVSLDYPEMIPFLENSPRRDLREQLRFKSNTASIVENKPILEEGVRIRQEIAEAFGQQTWSDHRLEDRMAGGPKRVKEFYASLRPGLTKRTESEIAAISQLLEADTGDSVVQGWDWAYYDTQQRKIDYGVDNFEVANYLPLDQVLQGMFDLTSEMFGITYRELSDFDSWHEDVRMFAIHDAETGEELSRFYLDLFPREGKYGHAAEFPLVPSRRLEDGSYQNPLCAMVCNFTKPTPEAPSLLQHSEVETFFHEFGHVLHQNLGRTELGAFSGTNTERDFVEAPSQIMENWTWDAQVLRRFARHYETGEPIPDELVDQMVAARDLNRGRFYLGQMVYGWWDQEIHNGPDRDIQAIHDRGAEIGLLPLHEGTFQLASFGHLMGGYDSSYYGYMWSDVFGTDMYSKFEEMGNTNPEVGMLYRKEILGRGGTLDADELLVNFLGREPSNEAFLSKLGIEGTN